MFTFLTEEMLKFIPFVMAGAVLIIAAIVYLIIKAFKEKK